MLHDLRLSVSNVNAFTFFALGDTYHPSWIDPQPQVRAQRVEHTENSIRMARDLGSPSISLEPGGPIPGGMSREDALEHYRLGLQMVHPLARELDIQLLVEPEPELLIETSDQFLEFIGTVPYDHVGLNFDIGHFYCVGEDPAEAVHKLAPWIRHVHVEDIAASRQHKHLAPGQGAINFRTVFRALRDIGYDGYVTVELYLHEATARQTAQDALHFLEPLL